MTAVNPSFASGCESVNFTYGLISYIGVPSTISTPETNSTGPLSAVYSMCSNFTHDSPISFGLNGDLVANTPIRTFPPSLGGVTVDAIVFFCDLENCHKTHICEKSSNPLKASGCLYSGSNVMTPFNSSINPLCLGIPNFVGKSVEM